jgi:aquaporin Z
MSDSARTWLAEALGAFVLVLGGGLAILSSGGNVVAIAFGFGLALLAGLYAFGEVSGGHYNPAVTLGAFLDGRIDSSKLVTYIVAQSGGAVLAGWVILVAKDQDAVASTATVPSGAVSTGGAFLIELLLAGVLVAVILKVTTSEMFGSSAFGAIALTYVAIHLAAWPLTGASVNPARTLGPAIAGGEYTDFWIYVTAPFIGAAFGWVLYKAVTTEVGERPLE